MKTKAMHFRSVWTGLMIALVFAAFGVLAGCAPTIGAYGSLKRSQELNQQIMNYEVFPDYSYYISGSYGKPSAIIGIHNDYQLVSGLWAPVKMDSAQLEKYIVSIDPESYRGMEGYFAAYILAPDGKTVGIWYSIQNSTTVKFPAEYEIEVYPPRVILPSNMRR